MLIEIPPKYSIAQVMVYIKGKSTIYIARKYGDREKYFCGQHFWARGYFVSTVGRNEEAIRRYIQNHEAEDIKLDQSLGLFPELWTKTLDNRFERFISSPHLWWGYMTHFNQYREEILQILFVICFIILI